MTLLLADKIGNDNEFMIVLFALLASVILSAWAIGYIIKRLRSRKSIPN